MAKRLENPQRTRLRGAVHYMASPRPGTPRPRVPCRALPRPRPYPLPGCVGAGTSPYGVSPISRPPRRTSMAMAFMWPYVVSAIRFWLGETRCAHLSNDCTQTQNNTGSVSFCAFGNVGVVLSHTNSQAMMHFQTIAQVSMHLSMILLVPSYYVHGHIPAISLDIQLHPRVFDA